MAMGKSYKSFWTIKILNNNMLSNLKCSQFRENTDTITITKMYKNCVNNFEA